MDNIDLTWKGHAQEIGINIAIARTVKRHPQDRVAADAGLSRFTYWKLECGESNHDTQPQTA
ncbi:hypothetical protein [Bifidobacterium polysaccharolyticum]|uniref:XRE family transcriptional regulator n=1 Tax=Bifidobacterium polysaccharolyticum TaxID=2750967 RepID=A0ABS0QUN3_9BIFI|nr:hypothetical protein [Bifidobacterium polysaccharolyticum]MBI0105569.1 hypothetical protein [Bifidobacterium polysaccharolyticum]